MHGTFPTVVTVFASYAAAASAQSAASAMPAISLTRDTLDSQPMVVAAITNRAPHPICIPAEVLQNESSIAVTLDLRDIHRRAVRFRRNRGYIPPPRPGFVRLEPGATTTGRYNLFRFRTVPARASVRLSFSFDRCNGTPPLRATSGWQPF